MIKLKRLITAAVGFSWTGFITALYGSVNDELKTLLILILIDLICGLITAAIFKRSPKTETGGLSSNEMRKGVFKKIGILLIVAVAHQIDVTLNINYIMYACEVTLIAEEILSIIESTGLMGIPIPSVIKNSIDLLNRKVNDILKGDD
jgi:toxin secretion/phage lysis holin